jgi:hypothetical protein
MTRSRLSAARCALLVLMGSLFIHVGHGQTVTGSISGDVKDSSGLALAGAKVEVLNTDTGVNREIQADAQGHYAALLLPLGNYKVTASQMGFQTEARSGIELTIGREAVVDLTLAVGSTSQTVEVQGEAALINTTSSQIQGLVAGEQIRELPLNGRSYNDLALLNPGVIYNKMTGSSSTDGFGARMSVSGARTTYNLYLIDGTMINDTSQTAGTVNADSLGVEGIREFTVLTHNYGAEFGLRAGGVVNAVTRSGTNQMHGSLYEFIRNSAVDAKDFFAPAGPIAPFRRNQFGGSVGGRIIKDKLFYFGNYEGFRQSLTIPQISSVPTLQARQGILPCSALAAGICPAGSPPGSTGTITVSPLIKPYLALYALPTPGGTDNGDGTAQWIFPFKQPINEDFYMGRVDYHISDADNMYVRYIYDPSTRLRPSGDPQWSSLDNATNYFSQIGETHIFSPTVINDFRAAFNRTDRHTAIGPVDPAIASLVTPDLSFVPGLPIGRLNFPTGGGAASSAGGLAVLGNLSASPTVYIQNVFEEGDTLNLVRGKHAFKFGVDLQRIQTQNISGSGTRGSWLFGGLQSFLQAQPTNIDAGKVLGLTSLGTNSVGEFGWRQWTPSFFVADDWRISSRLTLNLGVRWEFMTDPHEVNNLSGTLTSITATSSTIGIPPYVTEKKNFAPRAGFAWDPTGKGKTSLRGGVGLFYNQVNIKEAGPPADYQFNATFTAICNWTGAANPCASFPLMPPNPPLSTAKGETMTTSPLKTPTVLQYGLEIQQQFTSTTVLRVGYVGWKGYNMTRTENINDKPMDPATGTILSTAVKPNAAFGTITYLAADAIANYNSLQAEFKKRFGKGLSFQASYTYSKLLGDSDSTSNRVTDNTGTGYVSLVPNYPLADYGRGAYDQRHTFVLNGLYNLPGDQYLKNKFVKGVFGGWALNGIWQYGSGIPLNINTGFNRSGNGDPTQPDRPFVNSALGNNPINGVESGCAGIAPGQPLQTPNRWFDPCAFSLPPAGTLWAGGTVGKSTVNGPGTDTVSVGLSKSFSFTERVKLQVRAEAFNLFNHAQFGVPNVLIFNSNGTYAGTGGQITLTQGGGGLGGRNLQLGMKMTF